MRNHYFHLSDFPRNRTFILLNKTFHKRLFKCIDKTHSFKELRKKFEGNLNYSTYKKWKYRAKKRNSKFPRFIPLTFITEISKMLGKKCDINKIERNVIAYKGPSSSSIIWQPNLPLKEGGRILKILAHFLGDGHADGAFGTGLPKGKAPSNYGNTNNALLAHFKKDLKVFGRVHTSKYDHGTGTKSIILPNLIGYILEHIYRVNTATFDSKVPKRLYRLPKKLISHFIRAFFDDESHVYDSSIEVYSGNEVLISGVLNLLKTKFPEISTSKIKVNKNAGKNIKYSFSILSNSLEDYKNLIGFDHSQKIEDLNFNIRRQKIRKNNGNIKNAKELIKNILKRRKMTAKQLSRELIISHVSTLKHLNELKKNEKVQIIEKGLHNENIWKLCP